MHLVRKRDVQQANLHYSEQHSDWTATYQGPLRRKRSEPRLYIRQNNPGHLSVPACFPWKMNRALLSPRAVGGSGPSFCSPTLYTLVVLFCNNCNQGNVKSHKTALRFKHKRYVTYYFYFFKKKSPVASVQIQNDDFPPPLFFKCIVHLSQLSLILILL